MKIIIVLLQGSLLTVLSQQQETCRKERQPVWFYIYNANVNIPVYACVPAAPTVTDACKIYNYKEVNSYHSGIIDACINRIFGFGRVIRNGTNIYDKTSHKQIFLKLCELTAYAKLFDNTVESEMTLRQYVDGTYYNTVNGIYAFWIPNVCQNLNLIYNGNFNVWSLNETKYIRNDQISLTLTGRNPLCSSEIWKTNYDGIIVSTQHIKTLVTTNLPQIYETRLPYDCENVAARVSESTTTPPNISHNTVFEFSPRTDIAGTEKLYQDVTDTKINDKQKTNISDPKTIMLCLMCVVILIVLWYAFNVTVNFSSLWTAGKTRRSKSRAYLMYCVSQSLTNRYLYLDEQVNKKNEPNNLHSLPQLYETVE